MRRKDREMDRDFALEVIDNSDFGVMGICGDEPYTLPLSIVRKGNVLYFHSAPAGRKVDLIKDGDTVSVTFVSYHHIPELFKREEVEEFIKLEKYSQVGSKVYTTEFKSAHVIGEIYRVFDEEEMREALILIAEKYTPEISDLAIGFIENSFHRTAVYKIEIKDIKGKRKKFNKAGEELKFQKPEED